MLFSEIYGSYFNVVAAVLSEASDGKLTDRRMTELVREKAFAESALAIPAALKSGTWPLLDQEYHSILHHKPTMPLTMLQKRWLKALLSDPRIALFDPDTTGLEDVDPLYAQDTFILFDQYADGDPYGDPAYIACFQTALKAIRKKRKLRIRFRGHTGARHSIECIPYRLEYSAKDDKFRLLATGKRRLNTINMARVHSCELLDAYYAIIDLVSGKKENVLQYLSAYLDEKIKSLKTESGIFTAEDFTYILVVPLKEGFPGMWSAIGRMLDRDDVEAGIPEMCAALDHLYYDSKNESIIESLTQVLQCNPKILLAKELLGYTYYNMQMLGNALSYFEQFEDGKPTSRIFLEGTVYFWMAWCYGKKKDCLKEEEYYRKSLEALPVGENTLNNLGYSLYKQRKFKEAQSVFEDCLRQNRDVRYAANNLVRTLLAQGKNGEAQRVIQEHERFVSKDLKKRAEKPVGKVKIAVPEPAVTDVEAETIVDIGVKKQQFSSEKLLEDELVQRMEIGIPVFGMPLRIYQKRGVYGRQFVLRNGRLDILGIDTAGDLYVIELKKDSGYDDAYAQTREYIDWIEEDVAVKGQRVFGIICLNDPTKDLIEKVKADDQMRLFEYSISYSEII